MPREVIVDEVGVGSGTIVEQELARRLHAASIAQVTIERAVSARELGRFCFDLIQCDTRHGLHLSLIDLLEEHGVSRIGLRAAYRPQVLEISAPSAPVASLIEHQRARRQELLASGGPIDHLYPPDKGWIRIDPTSRFEQVSLVDLALLAQDPSTLAGMLLRLTEDDVSEQDAAAGDALSRKFSDVATLFAALDPRVSRVMFGKLARAVLDLQPETRQTLLRKTILPGLLDGKIDGAVLKDFPDVDLAESLCLLLDLETAAPEVVSESLPPACPFGCSPAPISETTGRFRLFAISGFARITAPPPSVLNGSLPLPEIRLPSATNLPPSPFLQKPRSSSCTTTVMVKLS